MELIHGVSHSSKPLIKESREPNKRVCTVQLLNFISDPVTIHINRYILAKTFYCMLLMKLLITSVISV